MNTTNTKAGSPRWVACVFVAVFASVLAVPSVALADSHTPEACEYEPDATEFASRGYQHYCVGGDGTAGSGETFLGTPAGQTIQNISRLLAYVLAIWGVVKAATKAFGRQGGEQGGLGVFAKALPLPLIGAAFLFNLQWSFNLLSWATEIIKDAVSLIGNAV